MSLWNDEKYYTVDVRKYNIIRSRVTVTRKQNRSILV